MLVLDGRPVERDAHLDRIQSSLAVLYPHLTPPRLDVPGVVGPYASSTPGTSPSALRIEVAPGADGELAATVEQRLASGHFATENGGQSTTRPVALRSLALADGLGAHKWADRSLLDETLAALPDDALPLVVDGDEALEASRANVFAVRNGVLRTPPLDGRILPGVTRMRLLEIAASIGVASREEPLDRGALLTADEVFLTGSVRGIEPVRTLDGTPLPTGRAATKRLADMLRLAWAETGT